MNVAHHRSDSTLCFTVKSADSGIQNSADGSREMLATTPSNNSLADAGKTQTTVSPTILFFQALAQASMRLESEPHICMAL